MVTLGTIFENALAERDEVGDSGQTRARYTLKQLLDPAFNLPSEGGDLWEPDTVQVVEGMFYDEVR